MKAVRLDRMIFATFDGKEWIPRISTAERIVAPWHWWGARVNPGYILLSSYRIEAAYPSTIVVYLPTFIRPA